MIVFFFFVYFLVFFLFVFFFFFNDTATTEIYTLSLHDAPPIKTVPPPPGTRPIVRLMSASVQNMLDAPVVDRCHRPSGPSGGGPQVGISTLGSWGKWPVWGENFLLLC